MELSNLKMQALQRLEALRGKMIVGDATSPLNDEWTNDTKNDFAEFGGVLKDSPNFNGDPLEIQHRMRDEW
jgi:hypothetical protein